MASEAAEARGGGSGSGGGGGGRGWVGGTERAEAVAVWRGGGETVRGEDLEIVALGERLGEG